VAGIERIHPDAGNAAGNSVTSAQACWELYQRGLALVEQYSIHTAVKLILRIHRYRCQAQAEKESILPDIGDAIANYDVGQAAPKEGIAPNTGDAVRNRDANRIPGEGRYRFPITTILNSSDQQIIDVGWNDYNRIGPGISGDGDGVRIVGIYGVIEIIT
jgi:hypothetical protein